MSTAKQKRKRDLQKATSLKAFLKWIEDYEDAVTSGRELTDTFKHFKNNVRITKRITQSTNDVNKIYEFLFGPADDPNTAKLTKKGKLEKLQKLPHTNSPRLEELGVKPKGTEQPVPPEFEEEEEKEEEQGDDDKKKARQKLFEEGQKMQEKLREEERRSRFDPEKGKAFYKIRTNDKGFKKLQISEMSKEQKLIDSISWQVGDALRDESKKKHNVDTKTKLRKISDNIMALSQPLIVGTIPSKKEGGTTLFERLQSIILPGYNYCGSGTDIYKAFNEGKRPTNIVDKYCREHDLDYLEISTLDDEDDMRDLITMADAVLEDNMLKISEMGISGQVTKDAMAVASAMKLKKQTAFAKDPVDFVRSNVQQKKLTDEQLSLLAQDILNNVDTGLMELEELDSNEMNSARSIFVHKEIGDLQELLGFADEPQEEAEEEKKEEEEDIISITTKRKKKAMKDEDDKLTADQIQNLSEEELDLAFDQGKITWIDMADEILRRSNPEDQKDEDDEPGEEEEEEREEERTTTTNIDVSDILKETKKSRIRKVVGVDEETFKDRELPAPIDNSIIGERSMRTLLFRETGESVELTPRQIQENKRWLENFTWVDPGFGNGNQQRLPWNLHGGRANNRLYEASMANQAIKYSGDLFDGAQEYRKPIVPSKQTMNKMSIPMIPNTQVRQRMIRNGPLPAGLGRPIQMIRDTNNIARPIDRVDDVDRRLLYPDVVDFTRV